MASQSKASQEEEEEEEEKEAAEEEKQAEFSSDNDGSFDEDMEALRRACMLAGTDPADFNPATTATATSAASVSAADSDSDFDDLELVRSIQQRFATAPLSLKPLSSIPPTVSDEEEDDFETLRAIQRRFAAYDAGTLRNRRENDSQKHEQVRAPSITSEKETSSNLFVNKTNSCEGCPDFKDARSATQNVELFGDKVPGIQPSGCIEWHQSVAQEPLNYYNFPNSAQLFIDAIKKNRSCQKFLRSKLIQIEAKLEENKKLKERVKILKDIQASCRRRMGRALSQKKDPRVLLISVPKTKASKNSKANDKNITAMYYGPTENSHVANYRMVLTKFPLSLSRAKWSKGEKENLGKGIKQQFQQMSFQMSVDFCSGSEGSFGDLIDFDDIMASIADFRITPEHIGLFLPKVNWGQLASMNVGGRSGAECEARWLNWENPLINHGPWTVMEDKKLLHILEQRGFNNWIDIASLLGTNRTPFQCLSRFQRSLNAFIMKRDWTNDEDAQLCKAVETFGEGHWQVIASTLEGRTGTQCSNRWKKSIHPTKREGRWTQDEDKRLKVAVMLFGPKTWNKIAQFVPGRTQAQCRERWVNSLDPSLNWDKWTEEEDSRLKAAITEYGYCWSKVAKCVPPRTDNQCWRRWKLLFPHEVALLREARKIQKVALISNFVDRESERPALGPNDFLPLPAPDPIYGPENTDSCAKQKKKSLRKSKSKEKCTVSGDLPQNKRIRSKKSRKEVPMCSDEEPLTTNFDARTIGGDDVILKKKRVTKPHPKMNKCAETTQDPPSFCPDSALLMITSGKEVDGVESLGGDITKKNEAPKPHSGKEQLSEADTIGGDDSILKNKRLSKQCPKRHKCTEPAQDHSSPCQDATLLMITNSREVEVFGGNDATKKKAPKPRSRRNKCCEVGKFGGDGTNSKKKSVTKPHSKKNECAEPTQDHSPSYPASTVLMITDGEEVQGDPIGGDDSILKNKRVTKPCSKRNKCAERLQDHSSPCRDSTLLMITNGKEVEAFDGDDAAKTKKASKPCSRRNKCYEAEKFGDDSAVSKKKSVTKPCSKKNGCTELMQDNLLSYPDSTVSMITNGEGVEAFGGEDAIEKKKTRKLHSRRNGSYEAGTFGGHNTVSNTKRRKTARFCSEWGDNIELVEDPDIISLPLKHSTFDAVNTSVNEISRVPGVHWQDRPKSLKTRNKSCSKRILGAADEDDMPLAFFLCDKMKRRLEHRKNGSQAGLLSSIRRGSELLSGGADQHHDGNRVRPPMHDCGAQTCRNGETSEGLSSCKIQSSHLKDMPMIITNNEPGGIDFIKGGTLAPCISLNGQVSISLKGIPEAVDETTHRCSPPPGFECHNSG